jgi:very-short-patch-repair endonuclease
MELKNRIRALWCDSTEAERKLWQALQNPHNFTLLRNLQSDFSPVEPQDIHFVRHVALGDFFVDFLCADLKLVIELDGGLAGAAKRLAVQRTTVLQYRGFLVVRLFQHDILGNMIGVLDKLNLILEQRKHCLTKNALPQTLNPQHFHLNEKELLTWI